MPIVIFYILISVILILGTPRKKLHHLYIFICLGFSVLAFFQYVRDNSDLVVAFRHLDGIRNSGWAYFDNDLSYFDGKWTLMVYFYVLSKLPYNNFYSAISMFFLYGLSYYVLRKSAAHFNVSSSIERMCAIILLLVIDFYSASNGVRNFLAFAFFAYVFYLDVVEHKNRLLCVILYLISMGIHSSIWVLLAIRLIMVMKSNFMKAILGIMIILWSYAIEMGVGLVASLNFIPGISSLYEKIYAYTSLGGYIMSSGANIFSTSQNYLMMNSIKILMIVVIIYTIYRSYKSKGVLSDYTTGILYISIFALGASAGNVATNVLARFANCLFLMMPYLWMENDVEIRNDKRVRIANGYSFNIPLFIFFIVICFYLFYLFRDSYRAYMFSTQLYH